MRTIALVLGDNDYGNTFKPLLQSLCQAITWNDGLSRDAIEAVVRSGIEFHYRAFQLGQHFGEPGYGSVESTVAYLSKLRILFDEEAEADVCGAGHDGGAWYLELVSGLVAAY